MKRTVSVTASWMVGAALLAGASASAAGAAETSGAKVIEENCGACHTPDSSGKFPRISDIRKSPEGWDMSVSRMQRWHGVTVSAEARAAIVKYLSDTQGLAPSESEPFRYALEQQPGAMENLPDPEMVQMCGRCHSTARPGLQRRDAAEWKRLINTHVGQWPTLEFQLLSRDRDWWTIANTTTTDTLAKMWGFKSKAWDSWKGHKTPDLKGTWAVAGHQPGKGDYSGTMTVSGGAGDRFDVRYDLSYADGSALKADGASVVYTGYEWRGTVTLNGVENREVMTLSADGKTLSGRRFGSINDELGADVTAVKTDGKPTLVAAQPMALKAGERAMVSLVGDSLKGAVSFGPGVTVIDSESKPWGLSVVVEVAARAAEGPREVNVGGASLSKGAVVYDAVDRVTVEPPLMIARVGDGGGPLPRHYAQFEAIGYLNGKDGKPGTADDIRLGALPASWSHDNFDEAAKELEDAKFAGSIDSKTGLFTPGEAGPNPLRAYKTNNVGNLKVVAQVDNGQGKPLSAESHLIVTVQRWVDGWIR